MLIRPTKVVVEVSRRYKGNEVSASIVESRERKLGIGAAAQSLPTIVVADVKHWEQNAEENINNLAC